MTNPYIAFLMFANLEDHTQACNDVNPFYYSPPLSLKWEEPGAISFTDGTYGMQKPNNPEAVAAISVPYTEVNYWDVHHLRVFPIGDY